MAYLLLTLLACGQAPSDTPLPGAPAPAADVDRLSAEADTLAAIRELPVQEPLVVRVVGSEAWERQRAPDALAASRNDHALALAGIGLLEHPGQLAAHSAARRPEVIWDRDEHLVLTTRDGLSHDDATLAAAHSVLPTCEPAAWTWDALRVADAVQEGMARVLTWEQDLVEAGLRPRGHAVDPLLPLTRWQDPLPPLPTPLDHDEAALEILGTDVVLRLLDAGAWRTVDMACAKLPSSTAALLHPERWQEGTGPDPVGPAEVPEWSNAGWRRVHTDRMGELGLRSWLVHTARVATESEAAHLAAGWAGDAVSVWQSPDSDELRAAWTIKLAAEQRKEAARLLHGRVLTDGRVVDVRPGPGDALVFLIGGSGAPVVTVLDAVRGGAVAVRLGDTIDAASWERTLRLQANTASASSGVARVGSLYLPLADDWSVRTRGMEGEVLSLRHRGTRLRLDLYEAPALLAGPLDIAAERIASLLSTQAGLDRPVHVRSVGQCTVATVIGRDRNKDAREIRVHTLPTDEGVVVIRASYHPRSVPAEYHRLVRSLEQSHCRGPMARRGYSNRTAGQ